MLVRRIIHSNPYGNFQKFLPTEPLGELINIGIRLHPLDEIRMTRLRAEMLGPQSIPILTAHQSMPHIMLLKSLGVSSIGLIRKTMMDIANTRSKFRISIDRIESSSDWCGNNCEQHLVIDAPEVKEMHEKLIRKLGDVPMLFTHKRRYKVSDRFPREKFVVMKSHKMPRAIAANYEKEFRRHHQHQMDPVTAVGLCLMHMQNVAVYGGNRIRISDMKESDITYQEIPFHGIASESNNAVPPFNEPM
ncbi:hypothetical protein MFRU_012g02160 [Monilinia fructicola]|nr:hypothetical protein MFRU_012g02160 [Monilinia fructicola]